MKKLLGIIALALASTSVMADDCASRAAEKKLAGAAKNSFLKKCHADQSGGNSCEARAKEKKLAGAAKNSFLKKCQADQGGTQ